MTSQPAPRCSPETSMAIVALRKAIAEANNPADGGNNPVGSARAVRRVAAAHPLPYQGGRNAFRWEAEKLLMPVFGNSLDVAKSIVWMCCDAAWESPRGR